MNSSLLLEAALRSVLLALAVAFGLRLFTVRNVLAQKAAWGLVLAAAVLMPVMMPLGARVPATLVIPNGVFDTLAASAFGRPGAPVLSAVAAPSPAPLREDRIQAGQIATQNTHSYTPAQTMELQFPEGSVAAGRYPAPVISSSRMGSSAIEPTSPTPVHRMPSLLQLAGLLYLAVAGAFAIRLLYGLVAAIDLWQSAEPAHFEHSTEAGGLSVRVSDSVSSPVTIGSGIVLPADFRDWDSEKLRIVLAHERSHVRQGDFYLQLLAGIYAAVVWFSPLGWWLKRKLSDLAEAISDRAGLEEAADRTVYAQILLEFAAAPRPTQIGVAMARNGSLSRRIERLLNDVSFRQAFAGSRRTLVAVLLVPVALIAATTLIRVQAAGQQAPEPPTPPSATVPAPQAAVAPAAPTSKVSEPEPPPAASGLLAPGEAGLPEITAPRAAAPVGPETPIVAPAAPVAPGMPVIAPAAPFAGSAQLTILPPVPGRGALTLIAPKAPIGSGHASLILIPGVPPRAILAPSAGSGAGRGYGAGQSATMESGSSSYSDSGKHSGHRYSYSSNGDSYAIIRGDDTKHISFSGEWMEGRREELEKARRQAHGDFLWFTRAGKDYFVDDASTLAQIEAMYKPMEDLGKQQEALGKQQEDLGKQQEALGRQQEKASVPTPDMSKEIAEIDEAMARLKANQGKSMSQEQFADLQSKLGDLQGRLGDIQGQIGTKQGEFGDQMGKLGVMQSELGAKQGRLGEEQGRIAQEADRKVKSIIDESLKNGKAHPLQ